MRLKLFRKFILAGSVCIAFSITLGGCTKKKTEYTLKNKFVYNSVQESEKETVDNDKADVQNMEEDNIGHDIEDNGVVYNNNGDGTVTIMNQQTMSDDVLPDLELKNLEDVIPSEEPVTESATDETEKSKDADKADDNSEKADKDGADSDSSNESESGNKKKPSDHGNVSDSSDSNATTEAPGDKVGTDDNTQPGQTTDNGKDGDDGDKGDSGDKGSNPNKQGTSTSTDAGRDDGSGSDGDGNPGGNKPGNNGGGEGDSGNGGDGNGGNNGDGDHGGIGDGDGDKGGDDEGDAKKDPDKAVNIWYEGVLGNYIWGEKVDTSGIKVYAEFEDGSKREIEDYTINMNYPERYVADESSKFPITYDVGVYNATISYQNVQVLCPYNLVAVFLSIYGDCYYGKCNDPEGHHAWAGNKINNHPEYGQYYVCDRRYDCYVWRTGSDGKLAAVSAVYSMVYVPVYYDYVYTQEDLLSDDYYANVYLDIDSHELFGGPITLYKDSLISDSYYAFAGLGEMYLIQENPERVNEYSRNH